MSEENLLNFLDQSTEGNLDIWNLVLKLQSDVTELKEKVRKLEKNSNKTSNVAENSKLTTIECAAGITFEEINLFEKAKMTTTKEYKKVGLTENFLESIKLLPRRKFVIEILLKLFTNDELYGKSSTGHNAPSSKGGHPTIPIDQKRKAFIEGSLIIDIIYHIYNSIYLLYIAKVRERMVHFDDEAIESEVKRVNGDISSKISQLNITAAGRVFLQHRKSLNLSTSTESSAHRKRSNRIISSSDDD